jgi:hypothetical protein
MVVRADGENVFVAREMAEHNIIVAVKVQNLMRFTILEFVAPVDAGRETTAAKRTCTAQARKRG